MESNKIVAKEHKYNCYSVICIEREFWVVADSTELHGRDRKIIEIHPNKMDDRLFLLFFFFFEATSVLSF